MNGDLQPTEVKKGSEVFFFEKPKDSIPAMRTTVHDVVSDYRGKWYIEATGLPEPYPIYHFKIAPAETIKYSSSVPIQECDDLFKRAGY